MLELLYEMAKDAKEYFAWKERDKVVTMDWVRASGYANEAERAGYTATLVATGPSSQP